jgi:hypothetical protein
MTSRQLLASLLVVTMTTMSAACTASWPRVTAISHARFRGAAAPLTIDLLPIDLEVWTHPDIKVAAEPVRLQAESGILATTSEALYRRGYAVGALLDWKGGFVSRAGQPATAYSPDVLMATVDSLASYGTAMQLLAGHELPPPYLPARLGEATGSEATLYIGGWGFVGRKRDTGGKILTGIALAVLVVGVVVVLAALDDKGKGVDKVLDGAAKGAGHVAKLAGSAGRVAFRAAARAGTAMIDIARVGLEVTADVVSHMHVSVDAFGRDETHRNLVAGRPEWSQAPDAKRDGESALYLEMTLVDNQSGLVRWHAHQQFPANPQNRAAVARAVASMLAALPGG